MNNMTETIYTEKDKKVAYKFLAESLDSSGLLAEPIQKKCQFVIDIKPTAITFMVYNKSNFLQSLRRALGKQSPKDKPFAKYEIDWRGGLFKYDLDSNPNPQPEQIDAVNYHAFKEVYKQENRLNSVKTTEKEK